MYIYVYRIPLVKKHKKKVWFPKNVEYKSNDAFPIMTSKNRCVPCTTSIYILQRSDKVVPKVIYLKPFPPMWRQCDQCEKNILLSSLLGFPPSKRFFRVIKQTSNIIKHLPLRQLQVLPVLPKFIWGCLLYTKIPVSKVTTLRSFEWHIGFSLDWIAHWDPWDEWYIYLLIYHTKSTSHGSVNRADSSHGSVMGWLI